MELTMHNRGVTASGQYIQMPHQVENDTPFENLSQAAQRHAHQRVQRQKERGQRHDLERQGY
jgi:hypothetical protein